MKKLVIHPKDNSTFFLNKIYKEDVTLITEGVHKEELRKLINGYDQIIMLGHGTSFGLLSVDVFPLCTNIIDYTMVPYLINKPNIYIWCNADKFVNEHQLKGFYSGMFISELAEAHYEGVKGVTKEMVNKSNEVFSEIVGKYINMYESLYEAYINIVKDYKEFAYINNNPVAQFNSMRLYYNN